jgi:hypothetical protein
MTNKNITIYTTKNKKKGCFVRVILIVWYQTDVAEAFSVFGLH